MAAVEVPGSSSTLDPFQDVPGMGSAGEMRFPPGFNRHQSIAKRAHARDSSSTYDSLLRQRLAAVSRRTEVRAAQADVAMPSPEGSWSLRLGETTMVSESDCSDGLGGPAPRPEAVGATIQDRSSQPSVLRDGHHPSMDATTGTETPASGPSGKSPPETQPGYRIPSSVKVASRPPPQHRASRSTGTGQEAGGRPGIMPYTSLADFQNNRLPAEMTPSFMGRGDTAKRQRATRNGWFREKALLERQVHEDNDGPQSDPELRDHLSTKEPRRIFTKYNLGPDLAKKAPYAQPVPGEVNTAAPAPSRAFARAFWDSLKRGTGRLLPRKSTAKLGEEKGTAAQPAQESAPEVAADPRPHVTLPRLPFAATQRRRRAPASGSSALRALFQHPNEPVGEARTVVPDAHPTLPTAEQPRRSARTQRSMPNLRYRGFRRTGPPAPASPGPPPHLPLPPLPPKLATPPAATGHDR